MSTSTFWSSRDAGLYIAGGAQKLPGPNQITAEYHHGNVYDKQFVIQTQEINIFLFEVVLRVFILFTIYYRHRPRYYQAYIADRSRHDAESIKHHTKVGRSVFNWLLQLTKQVFRGNKQLAKVSLQFSSWSKENF